MKRSITQEDKNISRDVEDFYLLLGGGLLFIYKVGILSVIGGMINRLIFLTTATDTTVHLYTFPNLV